MTVIIALDGEMLPEQRLITEVELLGALPSLRLEVGPKPISRKVDKLSCIRSDRPATRCRTG